MTEPFNIPKIFSNENIAKKMYLKIMCIAGLFGEIFQWFLRSDLRKRKIDFFGKKEIGHNY